MLAPVLAYVGILAMGYGFWHMSTSITVIDISRFYIGMGLMIIGIPMVLYVCLVMFYIRMELEGHRRKNYF